MTSYGEIELSVGAGIVGKIRALEIAADSAIFPRLAITVGVALHELGLVPRGDDSHTT